MEAERKTKTMRKKNSFEEQVEVGERKTDGGRGEMEKERKSGRKRRRTSATTSSQLSEVYP